MIGSSLSKFTGTWVEYFVASVVACVCAVVALRLINHDFDQDHSQTMDESTRLIREKKLAVITEQGTRAYQEDTYFTFSCKGLQVIGVFDGHGGNAVSAFLAKAFETRLQSLVKRGLPLRLEAWPETISDLFDKVDFEMIEMLDVEKYEQIGSTATLGFVVTDPSSYEKRRVVFLANTGDSRTFVYAHDRPHYVLQTEFHKPGDPEEKARIERAGGYVLMPRPGTTEVARVNGILATSRSFGDIYLLKSGVIHTPDIYGPWHVTEDQDAFLVAGSDGLYDCLDMAKVVDTVKFICETNPKSGTAYQVAQTLAVKCKARGIEDNMTVVVLKL